ncbi:MAG: hypothetical protein NXI24_08190 [bacterium]|nr:hypothetical protein [bacterium]
MRFKELFAAIAIAVAATTACWGGYDEYDIGPFPYYWLFMFPNYNADTNTTVTLIDRRDGTVEVRSERGVYTNYRVLVKRCRQGHTFQSSTNTCVAPVSESSAEFNYCATNNNACNDSDGALIGISASEAFDTCTADTLRTLSWHVASGSALRDIMEHPDRDTVFPDLGDDWLWANQSRETTTASVYRKLDLTEFRSKSEKHGVLCQHSGDFL